MVFVMGFINVIGQKKRDYYQGHSMIKVIRNTLTSGLGIEGHFTTVDCTS